MRITQIQEDLRLAVERALDDISKQILPKDLPRGLKIELEIPKDYTHGDLTTNAAFRLAKNFSASPIKLAAAIKDELEKPVIRRHSKKSRCKARES